LKFVGTASQERADIGEEGAQDQEARCLERHPANATEKHADLILTLQAKANVEILTF
jgi:hypothetical protein